MRRMSQSVGDVIDWNEYDIGATDSQSLSRSYIRDRQIIYYGYGTMTRPKRICRLMPRSQVILGESL